MIQSSKTNQGLTRVSILLQDSQTDTKREEKQKYNLKHLIHQLMKGEMKNLYSNILIEAMKKT